jgi:hypothetical protein
VEPAPVVPIVPVPPEKVGVRVTDPPKSGLVFEMVKLEITGGAETVMVMEEVTVVPAAFVTVRV